MTTGIDATALRTSWRQVAAYGDAVPAHFYSVLFLARPDLRIMFPASMATQRDRLVAALGHVVAHVDDLAAAVPFLQALGRDHRKFGVAAAHYEHVGAALLATLAYFCGEAWDEHLRQQWAAAYELVARVMIDAAAGAEGQGRPAYWTAEVVGHELRPHTSVAVLTLAPREPAAALPYVPGQSVAVETRLRPQEWRWFSPANAPRPDGSVELHVAAVPGGQVSTALVHQTHPGYTLRVGPPVGHRLTLADAAPGKPLLLLAGGTGLAPLRALVEQVEADTAAGHPARQVTLIHGGRRGADLYDLPALQQMAGRAPWLQLHTAVSDVPDRRHPHLATPVQAALAAGDWPEHLVYVCGPPAMVATTTEELTRSGHDPDDIRTEEFDTASPIHEQVGVQ